MSAPLDEWAGSFGREYTDRNLHTRESFEADYRQSFGLTKIEMNTRFLHDVKREARILEVGSGVGNQLACLRDMGFTNARGLELQAYAIRIAGTANPGVKIFQGSAFELPFKDGCFDLVFTHGLLIHIRPDEIVRVLTEIHRCSGEYIWGFEYYADAYREVVYRGRPSLLWKADFARLYRDAFPDLELVDEARFAHLDSDNVDHMFLLRKG